MIYSLGLQATYTHIDVGIFQDGHLILSAEKNKTLASRELIPLCAALLMETQKSLSDLAYIAINQGPAPFTTLRTVITTVNGLAYATNIPLIGIDGLTLLLDESLQRYAGSSQTPVVVLHAFGNDVYCGYKQSDGTSFFGCVSLPECIEQLSKKSGTTYVLVGNGALMHQESFKESLGDRVVIPEMAQPYASLTALGEHAWKDWQAKKTTAQAQPLYLKKTL
jgi:tRNA threonylcarbamoyladenosine biosynthesis protein TsaB